MHILQNLDFKIPDKNPTCFKGHDQQICIKFFLTNRPRCLKLSSRIDT